MIKGVNKNVIEISDTGNDSFERAILFVRGGRSHGDSGLASQAKEYVASLKLRHRFYTRGRAALFVTALISVIFGAGAATAFFLLF